MSGFNFLVNSELMLQVDVAKNYSLMVGFRPPSLLYTDSV